MKWLPRRSVCVCVCILYVYKKYVQYTYTLAWAVWAHVQSDAVWPFKQHFFSTDSYLRVDSRLHALRPHGTLVLILAMFYLHVQYCIYTYVCIWTYIWSSLSNIYGPWIPLVFNTIVSFQGNIGGHNGRNRVFCLRTSKINCSVGPTTNHQIEHMFILTSFNHLHIYIYEATGNFLTFFFKILCKKSEERCWSDHWSSATWSDRRLIHHLMELLRLVKSQEIPSTKMARKGSNRKQTEKKKVPRIFFCAEASCLVVLGQVSINWTWMDWVQGRLGLDLENYHQR